MKNTGIASLVALTFVTLTAACTIENSDADDDTDDAGSSSSSSSSSGSPAGDGGSTALGFTPSNIAAALVGLDLSGLADADIANSVDELGPACASNQPCKALDVTQADGSTIKVYIAHSWKIEPTAVVHVTEVVPVVLVAVDTITVLGQIDLGGEQEDAHGGGFDGRAAGGPGAGGTSQPRTNTVAGISGGGGSYCGLGGAGGGAASTFGAPGAAYGNATLSPLVGGSAGGKSTDGYFAGAGGGVIQLVAGTSITFAAGSVVNAGGGGGANGYSLDVATGGGSGGGILVEAPTVTVAGTLAANGGAGGGGFTAGAYAPDATGNATPAPGNDPGQTGFGGNGSGGATTAGTAGGAGGAAGGDNAPGGGGGGAGFIRINTRSAATISGTLSPAVGTACVSQGPLG